MVFWHDRTVVLLWVLDLLLLLKYSQTSSFLFCCHVFDLWGLKINRKRTSVAVLVLDNAHSRTYIRCTRWFVPSVSVFTPNIFAPFCFVFMFLFFLLNEQQHLKPSLVDPYCFCWTCTSALLYHILRSCFCFIRYPSFLCWPEQSQVTFSPLAFSNRQVTVIIIVSSSNQPLPPISWLRHRV